MSGPDATVVTAALAVIAGVQLVAVLVLALSVRRTLAEVRALRDRLQETLAAVEATLGQVSALATQAEGAVASAGRVAGHVAALAGAGRAVAESAIGQALLRRVLPRPLGSALSSSGDGSAAAGRFALAVALAAWRALAAHRRGTGDAALEPAPLEPVAAAPPGQVPAGRTGLGVGEVRRVPATAGGATPPSPRRSPRAIPAGGTGSEAAAAASGADGQAGASAPEPRPADEGLSAS